MTKSFGGARIWKGNRERLDGDGGALEIGAEHRNGRSEDHRRVSVGVIKSVLESVVVIDDSACESESEERVRGERGERGKRGERERET